MCGIVGFVSKHNKYNPDWKRHFMKYALALDTLRGEDSTGLFTVNQKGKIKTRHSLQSGDKFVVGKAFNETSFETAIAVGHNRAATRGSVTIQNAHPFTFGAVTLVHNGTLTDKGRSLDTFDDKLAVDSMQIALALSEVPPTDAAKVLSKVYGSFALVWYDTRDESINFARNSGRPLHACWNPQRDIMWFMSDADHLRAINKSMRVSQAQGGEIHQISSMHVVKFKLGGELKPKVQKFTQYIAPVKPRSANEGDWNPRGNAKRANKKWKEAVSRYKGVDSGSSELRVEVNGKRRKVPKGQVAALKEEYDIDPSMYCRFQVDTILAPSRQPRRQIVIGEIMHPLDDWEGTPWPAVLYDVPQVQAQAYKDVAWLVHPVGIAKVMTPENYDVPHILCTLVHCDWKGWNKERVEAEKMARSYNAALEQQQKEQGEPYVDLMLPGPEGNMIRQSKLKTLLINGCIQCSGTIDEDEITECLLVNQDLDILCPGCKKENDSRWEQHMREQAAGMVH